MTAEDRVKYWRRRADLAEQRLEFEAEHNEHTTAWAEQAFAEQRRLADRCTFLYGMARAAGCTVEELDGRRYVDTLAEARAAGLDVGAYVVNAAGEDEVITEPTYADRGLAYEATRARQTPQGLKCGSTFTNDDGRHVCDRNPHAGAEHWGYVADADGSNRRHPHAAWRTELDDDHAVVAATVVCGSLYLAQTPELPLRPLVLECERPEHEHRFGVGLEPRQHTAAGYRWDDEHDMHAQQCRATMMTTENARAPRTVRCSSNLAHNLGPNTAHGAPIPDRLGYEGWRDADAWALTDGYGRDLHPAPGRTPGTEQRETQS